MQNERELSIWSGFFSQMLSHKIGNFATPSEASSSERHGALVASKLDVAVWAGVADDLHVVNAERDQAAAAGKAGK